MLIRGRDQIRFRLVFFLTVKLKHTFSEPRERYTQSPWALFAICPRLWSFNPRICWRTRELYEPVSQRLLMLYPARNRHTQEYATTVRPTNIASCRSLTATFSVLPLFSRQGFQVSTCHILSLQGDAKIVQRKRVRAVFQTFLIDKLLKHSVELLLFLHCNTYLDQTGRWPNTDALHGHPT